MTVNALVALKREQALERANRLAKRVAELRTLVGNLFETMTPEQLVTAGLQVLWLEQQHNLALEEAGVFEN